MLRRGPVKGCVAALCVALLGGELVSVNPDGTAVCSTPEREQTSKPSANSGPVIDALAGAIGFVTPSPPLADFVTEADDSIDQDFLESWFESTIGGSTPNSLEHDDTNVCMDSPPLPHFLLPPPLQPPAAWDGLASTSPQGLLSASSTTISATQARDGGLVSQTASSSFHLAANGWSLAIDPGSAQAHRTTASPVTVSSAPFQYLTPCREEEFGMSDSGWNRQAFPSNKRTLVANLQGKVEARSAADEHDRLIYSLEVDATSARSTMPATAVTMPATASTMPATASKRPENLAMSRDCRVLPSGTFSSLRAEENCDGVFPSDGGRALGSLCHTQTAKQCMNESPCGVPYPSCQSPRVSSGQGPDASPFTIHQSASSFTRLSKETAYSGGIAAIHDTELAHFERAPHFRGPQTQSASPSRANSADISVHKSSRCMFPYRQKKDEWALQKRRRQLRDKIRKQAERAGRTPVQRAVHNKKEAARRRNKRKLEKARLEHQAGSISAKASERMFRTTEGSSSRDPGSSSGR